MTLHEALIQRSLAPEPARRWLLLHQVVKHVIEALSAVSFATSSAVVMLVSWLVMGERNPGVYRLSSHIPDRLTCIEVLSMNHSGGQRDRHTELMRECPTPVMLPRKVPVAESTSIATMPAVAHNSTLALAHWRIRNFEIPKASQEPKALRPEPSNSRTP